MKTVYDLSNDTDRLTVGMHLQRFRDDPAWEALTQVAAHLAAEDLRKSRPRTLEDLAEFRGRAEGVKVLLAFLDSLSEDARDKSRAEAAADTIQAQSLSRLPGLNTLD